MFNKAVISRNEERFDPLVRKDRAYENSEFSGDCLRKRYFPAEKLLCPTVLMCILYLL